MDSPKETMRTVRKSYKLARKEHKQTYKHQKAQSQRIFRERSRQAEVIFSDRPDQLKDVRRQLVTKQEQDIKRFKNDREQRTSESKTNYLEQVKEAPASALTARELKHYKLPELTKQYQEAKSLYKDSQKDYRTAHLKALVSSAFSYGQKEKEASNFNQRQSNFRPYQTEKMKTKVRVQKSQSKKAQEVFQRAKNGRFILNSQVQSDLDSKYPQKAPALFTFDKKYHTSSSQAGSGTLRFKRNQEAKKPTQHTTSGRFFYDTPELKEKKAAQTKAKADFQASKTKLKQGKRSYHFKRPRTKVLLASRFVTREGADLLADNEDLSGIRDIQQATRKMVNYSKFTYRGAKGTVAATKGTIRFGQNRYSNLKERTANFKAGRGFKLNDPKRHMNQRVRNYFRNMGQNVVNAYKRSVNFIKNLPKALYNLMLNPMTWLVGGVLLLLFMIVSVFISVNSRILIQQDEFELNKAYTHMTLKDAEQSISEDNGTTYYTKIDDVMAYMNYRFQDYSLAEATAEVLDSQVVNINSTSGTTTLTTGSAETYKDYLSTLWTNLNGGDSLKSMADLYKENGKYTLSREDIEDFEEMKADGIYLGLWELDNPFQGETDETVLSMTYRYGYYNTDGKAQKSNYIILEAKQDQVIVAPMDGIVKIEGEDIIIVSSEGKIVEARLRLKDIATGRVTDGQKVYTGDIIGQTKTNQGLKLYYQKYNDDKEKLVYVNPAFYFLNVVQVQTTILPNIGQFQGDEVGRAKVVYDFLKSKGASNQFIAAVLGNWSVESSVTAKRAEGDYLAPPIGASEGSWDDDAWLSMNGPTIYNGRYPNITRRGLGLGQWTDTADGSTRHTLLKNYSSNKGKKWYDLDLQLDFLLNGDSPFYTSWISNHMKDTGSPATLTQLFLIYWEGNSGDKLIERQKRAIEWFYQIEKGFSQPASGTAQVDVKTLESIKGDLYDGVVPGGGSDMGYPWGQCTWGTAKRINQLGLQLKGRDGSKIPIISTMGNGKQWVGTAAALGGETGRVPKDGAIVSFEFGDPWGHVAFVEKVYPDGSFLISEANYNGSAYNPTGKITFRTISGADASMTFAYTTK